MSSQVLASVALSPLIRALQRTGLAIGAAVALCIALGALAFALMVDGPIAGRVLIAMTGMSTLLLVAPVGWYLWRAGRLAMIVRTDGIECRGPFRDRFVPWEKVRVIEAGTHPYWRRAVDIVTIDGARISPMITAHQYQYMRGEPADPAAKVPGAPLLPVRIAQDAHRRYLAGEFARAS